jgi:hypothetical protein
VIVEPANDDLMPEPEDQFRDAFAHIRDLIEVHCIGQFEMANAIARLDEAAYWTDRAL